jgi:TRAP-type C4-dicarboxylate transport system permease small subunit
MITGMGAVATPVEVSELATALATGLVVGQENPLPNIYTLKLYEVQKYVMMTNHMQSVLAVFINEKAYQSIPAADRKIMDDTMIEVGLKTLDWDRETSAKYRKDLETHVMALLRFIRTAVRWISLALLAALVVTPLAQITMRGLFNVPMAGAEEMARYFLICLTFIAGAYVTEQGGQIRMEEFQGLIAPKPRWILQLLIELCGAVFFAVLFIAGVITIRNNLQNQTAVMELPFWLFMGPLAVGSLLLVVETLMMLMHTWRRRRPEEKQTVLT